MSYSDAQRPYEKTDCRDSLSSDFHFCGSHIGVAGPGTSLIGKHLFSALFFFLASSVSFLCSPVDTISQDSEDYF